MTKGTFRKAGVAALSALIALVTFGVSPFAAPAGAQTEDDVACERIFGEDRYGTAAALALETFADTTVDTVFIARGDGTPNNLAGVPFDALAGSYGAGHFNAPILLVEGATSEIPPETAAAIETLDPTNAFVLGQEQAISEELFNEIDAMIENVERVGGEDRFHTAAIIAGASGAPGAQGTPFVNAAGESAVFLAAGSDAREGADALSAGGPAYAEHIPILLTQTEALNEHAAGFIEANDVERVYILGGEVAISSQTEQQVGQLNSNGTAVTRIFGDTRQATAVDLAIDFLIDELGWSTEHFNLANGVARHLVDAVASGPHAGEEESMILLTAGSDTLGEDTESFLEDLNDGQLANGEDVEEPQSAHIIGGPVAINQETMNDACTLAGVPVDQGPGGDAAALSLTPETDINPHGTQHTVVADVDNAQGGAAANGQTVRFEVYRDSDPSGSEGTLVFLTGGFDTTTGGTADFTYTGPATNNQDVIVSCVVPNQQTGCTSGTTLTRNTTGAFSNITAEVSDTAAKEWASASAAAAALNLTPETDINPSGQDHKLTATVTTSGGAPVAGSTVVFTVFVDTDNNGRFAKVFDYDTITGGTNVNNSPATNNPAGTATYTFDDRDLDPDTAGAQPGPGTGVYFVIACTDANNNGTCGTVTGASPAGANGAATRETAETVFDTASKEFVQPSPAPTGNFTGTVTADCDSLGANTVGIYTADNRFLILQYGEGVDTYTVDGANADITGFENACSVGDTLQSNYNATPGIQSTFALTNA